jgi:nicotinamidase-related amidase
MATALLIIDVQQGLCEGEHAVFESAAVIGRINRVSAQARAAGICVVASDALLPGARARNCP